MGRGVILNPPLTVEQEDSEVTVPTFVMNFEGDATVIVDPSDSTKATVTVGETGQFTGKLADFLFHSSGNVSNRWLGIGNGSTASDTLPLVIPQDSVFTALTFSNQDDNVDIDIEFYVNGVLDFTWEVRNKRTAWKTNLSSMSMLSQGDRLSCFMKKYTGGTGDNTAQDPVVEIFFTYQSDNLAEGGTQYGV